MVENMDKALDTALDELAREARAATPLPGPDLTARVLSDAAMVSSERAPRTVGAKASQALPVQRGIFEILFGWTSGAIAAVTVCMSVGIAVGMEIDASDLPMMGSGEIEMVDPMSSPSEADEMFGPEGLL